MGLLVCWLVFRAQSTARGYSRADKKKWGGGEAITAVSFATDRASNVDDNKSISPQSTTFTQ